MATTDTSQTGGFMGNWWDTNVPDVTVDPVTQPSTNTTVNSNGDYAPVGQYGDPYSMQVNAWYQQYLGRQANMSEINAHRGDTNGLSSVYNTIVNSPEAAAYKKAQASSPTTSTSGTSTSGSTTTPSNPGGNPANVALDYARSLGDPSDANLQKVADYMSSLGYDVEYTKGVDGMAINGVGVDMVQNYKGGGEQRWQYLVDDGTGGSSSKASPFVYADMPEIGAFNAPSMSDMLADPGYQARISAGESALQNSAASKGTLLTGGTQKALDQYSQDYASNEYTNAYNRAYQSWAGNAANTQNNWLQNYQKALTAYQLGTAADQQAWLNAYNTTGQTLSGLEYLYGTGASAANTLTSAGSNYANSATTTAANAANSSSNYATSGAAANAAGLVGSSNAWSNGLSNLVTNGMDYWTLANMLPQYKSTVKPQTSSTSGTGYS